MITRRMLVFALTIVFGESLCSEARGTDRVVFLKAPGPVSLSPVFEPQPGKEHMLSLLTGHIYEVTKLGNGCIHEVFSSPATPKRDRIEFGQLRFPYLQAPIGVEIYRDDTKVYGVVFGNLNDNRERSVITSYLLSKDNKPHCFHPVQHKQPSDSAGEVDSDRVNVDIHGQKLTGRLYIAPVKDRSDMFASPAEIIGEYVIVTDASQEFEYNRTKQQENPQERVVLFPSMLQTKADVRISDDGRLELSPQAEAKGLFRSGASSKEQAKDKLPQGLVFGRVVEVGRRYRPWVFHDTGVFDSLAAKSTKAVPEDSDDLEAYAQRGNIYRQTGEFTKALADYEKAGKPLEVEVVSENAPLMIGSKIIARLSKATVLRASKVNGKWLWGESAEHESGWIDQRHVC